MSQNSDTKSPKAADIYVDLGTANTLVVTKKDGLVANEPSVVAYMEHPNGKRSILAVGNDAKIKVGRTPGNAVAFFPLKEGFIADLETTKEMLKYFMAKAPKRFRIGKPRVIVSLPYGAKDIEKKAVCEAGMDAGAKEVILIEEPMAAAIGCGLPVGAPQANMIIDMGGGTTDIAVISLYGIVHCESIRVGGYAFDLAIIDYVRKNFSLVVGDQSAERIKLEAGSAMPGDHDTKASIRGIDSITGLPKEVFISSHQVYEAISPLLNQIVEATKNTLAAIPPDLVADVIRLGAKIAGGGALLRGLDKRLSEETGISVTPCDTPLLAIARGGEAALKDPQLLQEISID